VTQEYKCELIQLPGVKIVASLRNLISQHDFFILVVNYSYFNLD
jgi:hypothetical protein